MSSNFNHELATVFVQDPAHVKNLLYSYGLGTFFLYDETKGYFRVFSDDQGEFEKYLLMFLENRVTKNITMSLLHDIQAFIKLKVFRRIDRIESNYIALKSTLLNINSFEMLPFSVDTIAFTSLPFDSEELSKPKEHSLWLQFLDEVVVHKDLTPDTEAQALLQEMFGYMLMPSTKAEKAFFLVGDGANGKSVLLNVLRTMIGERNCSSKSIEALTTDKHATAGLVGKSVNICSEEESDYIKSDKFKALITGEPVDIQPKFKNATSGVLPVKFIFATNEMPTFSGFNDGLLRRMVVIPFLRTIAEDKRDVDLIKKILVELPSIVGWALEGAKRLSNRGFRFILPASSLDKQNEFKENLSSALLFVNENYETDPGNFISMDDLYAAYVVWTELRGVKKMKFYRFARDLTKTLGDTTVQRDQELGTPQRGRWLGPKHETLTAIEKGQVTF